MKGLSLQEVYAQLDFFALSMQGGILAITPDEKIVYTKKLEPIFGYTDEELLTMNLQQLLPSYVKAQHSSFVKSFLEGKVENRQMSATEVRAYPKNSTEPIYIQVALSKFTDNKNTIAIAFISLQDKNEVNTVQKFFNTRVTESVAAARATFRKILGFSLASLTAGSAIVPQVWNAAKPIVTDLLSFKQSSSPESPIPTLKALAPLSIIERNIRMVEVRDSLGALSVGLFRFKPATKQLMYIHDLDNPIDVYQYELSWIKHKEVFEALGDINCVELNDIAIATKDYPTYQIKAQQKLYTIVCPTINHEAEFDGMITAVFQKKPDNINTNLDPYAAILFRASIRIKQPTEDGWDFK